LCVTSYDLTQIIHKLRRDVRLAGKAQGYVQVRTSGPLTENGSRLFFNPEAKGDSIRVIVLPRDGCLSYKKETHE